MSATRRWKTPRVPVCSRSTHMPLHLHISNEAERLADVLGSCIAAFPPADPFTPARICVGSRGMERWLRNRLAQGVVGIAMHLEFPFPKQALSTIFVGEDAAGAVAADARWAPESLAWSVLSVLPGLVGDASAASELLALRSWLSARRREAPPEDMLVTQDRWALAREIADVLDKVALFRPDWVEAWEHDRCPPGPPAWQGTLWRALRRAVPGTPLPLRLGSAAPLPGDPLHLFAVSSMPPLYLQALTRAAAAREVHVYSLVPTQEYLGDDATRQGLRARTRRGEDVSESFGGQSPLLTALGRVAIDAQILAIELDLDPAEGDFVAPGCTQAESEHCCALHTLQRDVFRRAALTQILEDRRERSLRDDDDSLQFHDTHGPTRQVEAARDALLELFARHQRLEPRHVLIMTPDLETYAPLVKSVFQQGHTTFHEKDGWGAVGAPKIPTAIADLGIRGLNPLAEALLRLLELVEGRLTVTRLVDFAALDPVRRKFGLTDDDLVLLRGWLSTAGARWGADETERARHGNPEQREYTLAFALDRLALGATLADDGESDPFGVAPFDEMEGGNVSVFGKLAELCARLDHWRTALGGGSPAELGGRPARPLSRWLEIARTALDDVAQPANAAGFLRAEIEDHLDTLTREAAPFDPEIRIDAVRALLDGRFDLPRSGDRPSTGAVTVCAMQPMRSVPFEVIVLLGMDDGAFPRTPVGRGFDATLSARRVGDRDVREEDRNLLLETILSARSHLLIFYTGRDRQSNEKRAPAVPVGELLDLCDMTFLSPAGREAHPDGRGGQVRHALTRIHSVQPFSASGFEPRHAPGPARTARFDTRARDAAVALASARETWRGIGLDCASRTQPPSDLRLSELLAWLRKPVPQFMRKRLGVYYAESVEILEDREALDLDGLGNWVLEDRLVKAWLRGDTDLAATEARLRARAQLPPGAPGARAFAVARESVLLAAAPIADAERTIAPVMVTVDGVRITGEAALAVHRPGSRVSVYALGPGKSRKPEKMLRAWIGALAYAIHTGRSDVDGLVLGEDDEVRLSLPGDPAAALTSCVRLWKQAWSRIIPLAEKTSFAYAQHLARLPEGPGRVAGVGDALGLARKAWCGSMEVPGEDSQPELKTAFPEPIFDDALFDELARRLWFPILEAAQP